MKLISYQNETGKHAGLWINGSAYSLQEYVPELPDDMLLFLQKGEAAMEKARELEQKILLQEGDYKPLAGAVLVAPVPQPPACRDGYAFRQHVETARRNRNAPMIPEFDSYPVLYFTNHQSIKGPGDVYCMPDHFHQLDFELEAAVVIGRQGRNIRAENADEYIAGFTIMNDLSARLLQMEEMKLNLGPAKGKDFATCIGPWLVTPDELNEYLVPTEAGHWGRKYALEMTCRVNGMEVSRGNMASMNWTFAELIERASYGVDLYPGEVLGSGTVGTGCFLELNGTGLLMDPGYRPQWLKPGDKVALEIEGLGILENTIRQEQDDFSILKRKK